MIFLANAYEIEHLSLNKKVHSTVSFENCKEKAILFRECLLETIDTLYPHLDYWKHSRSLTATSISEKIKINVHIDALEQEITRNAHFLGLINELIRQFNDQNAQEKVETPPVTLASLMHHCFSFCSLDSLEEKLKGSLDQEIINKILLSTSNDMKLYTKKSLESIKSHQCPNHFTRHWLGYTLCSLSAVAILAYLHQNKEVVRTALSTTHESSKRFFNNHIYKPLKNAINIFYGKNQPKSIAVSEESIKRMIIEYFQDNHTKMKPEEMAQKAQEAAKIRELPAELIEECAKEIPNIRTNLLIPNFRITRYYGNGQYLRIKAIELEIVKLRLIDILQANRLNIELLLTIPVVALLYCSYKTSQIIYQNIQPQHIFYQPLKTAFLKIEHILNIHNNSAITMGYSIQGQLSYWLYKIQNYTNHVPFDKRISFLEDLEELAAVNLSISQKLSIINRMYRTYDFLNA
jgi:ATP synthase regulation protein NCA2